MRVEGGEAKPLFIKEESRGEYRLRAIKAGRMREETRQ